MDNDPRYSLRSRSRPLMDDDERRWAAAATWQRRHRSQETIEATAARRAANTDQNRRRRNEQTAEEAAVRREAHGQTLEEVGILLNEPIFSHGQLYFALSRARWINDIKILLSHGQKKNYRLYGNLFIISQWQILNVHNVHNCCLWILYTVELALVQHSLKCNRFTCPSFQPYVLCMVALGYLQHWLKCNRFLHKLTFTWYKCNFVEWIISYPGAKWPAYPLHLHFCYELVQHWVMSWIR